MCLDTDDSKTKKIAMIIAFNIDFLSDGAKKYILMKYFPKLIQTFMK